MILLSTGWLFKVDRHHFSFLGRWFVQIILSSSALLRIFRDNIWVTHKPGIWETGCSYPNYSIGGVVRKTWKPGEEVAGAARPGYLLTSLASDWIRQLVTLNLYLYRWQIKMTGAGVHIMGMNTDSNNWAEGVWQGWGSSFFSGCSMNFHRWN